MQYLKTITAEVWLAGMLTPVGDFGFLFLSQIVAEPEVPFGRSLTAVSPSLFWSLVLGGLAILGLWLLGSLLGRMTSDLSRSFEEGALGRVVLLFCALTMDRIGFFLSSFLSMVVLAWMAGNRSIPQFLAVSVLAPIGLYVISTRGFAVSLPELSAIKFLCARVLG